MSLFTQEQFNSILKAKGWSEVNVLLCEKLRSCSGWKVLDPLINSENKGEDLSYSDMVYRNEDLSGWLKILLVSINNCTVDVDYEDIIPQKFSTRFTSEVDSPQKLSFIILYFMLYSLEQGYTEGIEAGGGEKEGSVGHTFAATVLSRMNKKFKLSMYDPLLTECTSTIGTVTYERLTDIVKATDKFDVPVLFDVFDGGMYDVIQEKVEAPIKFTKHVNGCEGPLIQPGHKEVRCIKNNGQIICDQIDSILLGNFDHPYFDNCRNCLLWKGLCDRFCVPPLYVIQELANIGVTPCKMMNTVNTVANYVTEEKVRRVDVEFFNKKIHNKHPEMNQKKQETRRDIFMRLSAKYGANLHSIRDMDDSFQFDVGIVSVSGEDDRKILEELGYTLETLDELEGNLVVAQRNVTLYAGVQTSSKLGGGECIDPYCKGECTHPRYYETMRGSCTIVKGPDVPLVLITRIGKSGLLYHYSNLMKIDFPTLEIATQFISYYKDQMVNNKEEVFFYGMTLHNLYDVYCSNELNYDSTLNPTYNTQILVEEMTKRAKKLTLSHFHNRDGVVHFTHLVSGFPSLEYGRMLGVPVFSKKEALAYLSDIGYKVNSCYEVGYYIYACNISTKERVEYPFSHYIHGLQSYKMVGRGGWLQDKVFGRIHGAYNELKYKCQFLLIDWENDKKLKKGLKDLMYGGIAIVAIGGDPSYVIKCMGKYDLLDNIVVHTAKNPMLSVRLLVFKSRIKDK